MNSLHKYCIEQWKIENAFIATPTNDIYLIKHSINNIVFQKIKITLAQTVIKLLIILKTINN
jgi:hypothetical protein